MPYHAIPFADAGLADAGQVAFENFGKDPRGFIDEFQFIRFVDYKPSHAKHR
jgi:hypothetical protein